MTLKSIDGIARESIGPSSRRHFRTPLSSFIFLCPNECCFTSIVFVPPQTLPDPYRENHPDGQPCCLNAPQNTLPPTVFSTVWIQAKRHLAGKRWQHLSRSV